ncbi:recombinase [Paraburkholderia caribensis]|uniref:recombinase RecT n=1 Tax=Paraburkholderia caribensis TaxID=75105 RepID=UPI000D15D001|nr:recombinase RecT [Paraburkholderia caribensis]PTB23480.1 recombinase [Paraburkholderia caribensis]
MSNAVSTQRVSLVAKFADRYSVDPNKLMTTLKKTCFRQRGDQEVTDEQMMALLVVADQYTLNPFTREIFAYNDKGAIVPLVSLDGWLRIINEHPQFDGMEFDYSEAWETMPRGKPCPEWIECRIFRKDRTRPTIVREYLDECYQAPRGEKAFDGPWQNVTKRFLRHRAIIQCGRVAFGFAGLSDADDHQRIVDMGAAEEVNPVPQPQSRSARPAQQTQRRPAIEQADEDGVIDQDWTQQQAEFVQQDAEPVQQEQRAQRAAKPRAQPKQQQREPGGDDEQFEQEPHTPASESVIRILKTKMEAAALGEADMRKKFGFGYDGVTTANYNKVVAWIDDPMGA